MVEHMKVHSGLTRCPLCHRARAGIVSPAPTYAGSTRHVQRGGGHYQQETAPSIQLLDFDLRVQASVVPKESDAVTAAAADLVAAAFVTATTVTASAAHMYFHRSAG